MFCFHCWGCRTWQPVRDEGRETKKKEKPKKRKQNRAVVDLGGHCHSEAAPGSSRGLKSYLSRSGYTNQQDRGHWARLEEELQIWGILLCFQSWHPCVLTLSESTGKFKIQKYIWYLLIFFLSPEMTDLSLIKQ